MADKQRLCNVIDYKTDIEPFPLVKIYSGVGSGKSYFAAKMITGSQEYNIPQHNILLITSRRAKVAETLKEMGDLVTEKITVNGNLNKEVFETGDYRPPKYENYLKEIHYTSEWGDFTFLTYNKSVVCTNAYISAYLKYAYNPNDPTTHIWNKFDAIVVDEVHSLVTDSTYQAATFDVVEFIKEYLNLYKNNKLLDCSCKHMILMTGTPQPFEAHVDLDFPKELTNTMNLFDKCENVVPKNVIIIDKDTAKNHIKKLLLNGEKIIYFSNHTLTESGTKEKFELPDDINIGVSFSNEKKIKLLPDKERTKIKDINQSLEEHCKILEEIQMFVTTSRNKEGINIHNEDYHNMFVETHLMYDVVQMAGRIRKGVENLYIISNIAQFDYNIDMTDVLFTKKIMVANREYPNSENETNKYLIKEYLQNEKELEKNYDTRKENLRHYIDYIESRFRYIKYNVFKQKFEFYYIRESAEDMSNQQIEVFQNELAKNTNYIQKWFQASNVKQELSAIEKSKLYLNNVIGTKNYVTLKKEELRKVLSVIRENFNSDLTSTTPILHLVDENFNCERNGNQYDLYYGTENPRKKKKIGEPMRKSKKHQ